MSEPTCFLHGAFMPVSAAKVDVYDLALLRGFGIYEGIAGIRGEPFRFADHFARFKRSADALGLAIPFSESDVLDAMRKVIRENAGEERAAVRMILTGGAAEGGIAHVPGREVLYILAERMNPYPASWYAAGAAAIAHEHARLLPEFKTIDYTAAVLLQPLLARTGAAEAIYVSQGMVLECTGSNIFAVKNGALATPKDSVLQGITRKVTLELARAAGIPALERALPLAELIAADEAFITSSFKDIVPIVEVDGRRIGSGAPGPLTRDLMARFGNYIENL